jgi:mRNA interferase MazF
VVIAQRGEVWLVQFDPAVGDEIRKLRPAVVISVPNVGILKVRLVVPLTDWKPWYMDRAWVTAIAPSASNGLSKLSAADAFQCKSLSFDRFLRKVGTVTPSELQEIVDSVGLCIGL